MYVCKFAHAVHSKPMAAGLIDADGTDMSVPSNGYAAIDPPKNLDNVAASEGDHITWEMGNKLKVLYNASILLSKRGLYLISQSLSEHFVDKYGDTNKLWRQRGSRKPKCDGVAPHESAFYKPVFCLVLVRPAFVSKRSVMRFCLRTWTGALMQSQGGALQLSFLELTKVTV